MVVGDGLFYRFYYCTLCAHIPQIVQSKNTKGLPPAQQLDQACYALRYFINDIFLFLPMNKIILASQSPRRKQLLEWAEIPFDIIVKPTSEDYPPGLHPEQIAVHIAQKKAYAVQKQLS